MSALGDLVGALLPLSMRDVERDLDDRIRKIPTRLNEFGYDPWGLHPQTIRKTILPALALYKYWFRVETHDIERVPPGRALLIANHAGQLPFDLGHREPGRGIAQVMAELARAEAIAAERALL